jgi:hypothetical protein
MRLLLAGGAALALPPLRPRLPLARAGSTKLCFAATEFCAEQRCRPLEECCEWVTNPGGPTCQVSRGCCDPCGFNNKCGGGGCEPGGDTCAACCKQRGQGEPTNHAYPCECCPPGGEPCGTTGLCCTSDQICDKSRGICCPPDPDAEKCNMPEQSCRDRVDKEVDEYQRGVCKPGRPGLAPTSAASLEEKAYNQLGCMLFSETGMRFTRWDKCPQVAVDRICGNAACDPATFRCRRPGCGGGRQSRSDLATSSHAPPVKLELDKSRLRASLKRGRRATGVPAEDIRARIRRGVARTRRAARTLGQALQRDPNRPLPRADLARAIAKYRGEILRTRNDVAAGDGGRPQRLAVAAFDDLADALAAYHRASRAKTGRRAGMDARQGRQLMKKASRSGAEARRALGCGKAC